MAVDIIKRYNQMYQKLEVEETAREQAMQVFDGLMLGDGGLHRTKNCARFSMGLSGGNPNLWKDTPWSGKGSMIPQMQYLVYIMDRLEPLGIEFSVGYPKAITAYHQNGEPFLYCYIESLSSVFLLSQFERWYRPVTSETRKARWFPKNRRWYKILPDDTGLSPLTIAVLFEGDGSASWHPSPQVLVTLAIDNFTKEEVVKLSSLFSPFNVQTGVCRHLSKPQVTWEIVVSAIGSVNTFFDLTEKHIHPCYRYKIKRAKHASDCNTEEEKKSICERNRRNKEYQRERHRKRQEQATLSWAASCSRK